MNKSNIKKKIKVLIVVSYFYPKIGGMENNFRKFIVNIFSWKAYTNKLLKVYEEIKYEKN